MTENPYQSPEEPGAARSPRRPSRRLRTLVGVLFVLGGFAVLELGHTLFVMWSSQRDSILLSTGAVLLSLVGLGMLAAAGLMSVGLIWRPRTENHYEGRGHPGT